MLYTSTASTFNAKTLKQFKHCAQAPDPTPDEPPYATNPLAIGAAEWKKPYDESFRQTSIENAHKALESAFSRDRDLSPGAKLFNFMTILTAPTSRAPTGLPFPKFQRNQLLYFVSLAAKMSPRSFWQLKDYILLPRISRLERNGLYILGIEAYDRKKKILLQIKDNLKTLFTYMLSFAFPFYDPACSASQTTVQITDTSRSRADPGPVRSII
jgi:hypothetical protein